MRLPLAVPLVAALAVAPLAPARADWSVDGFVSQRIEANTNRGYGGTGLAGEPALSSRTSAGLVVTGRGPRGQITLRPGVAALATTLEAPELRNVAPQFSGSGELRGPRSRTTATVSLTPRFVNSGDVELLDSGDPLLPPERVRVEREVIRLVGRARLGQVWFVTPRDEISAGLSARATDYLGESGGLASTRAFGADLGWTRALTPRTSVSLSPAVERFSSRGGATESSGTTWSLVAGGTHQADERLSFGGRLGPSFTQRTEGGSSTVGVVGGVQGAYRLSEATNFSASLDQTVDQDSDGAVVSLVAGRASLSHAVNSRERLTLSSTLSFANPLFDEGGDARTSSLFTVTPAYALDLSRDWRLNAGYRFGVRRDDDGEVAVDNSVFLEVRRNFDVLP